MFFGGLFKISSRRSAKDVPWNQRWPGFDPGSFSKKCPLNEIKREHPFFLSSSLFFFGGKLSQSQRSASIQIPENQRIFLS